MANTKSAQKQAKQNIVKRKRNLARRTSIKTSVKKVLAAVEQSSPEAAQTMLRDAEAKMARASNKSVMHKNTARRKISRLAKKVAALTRSKSKPATAKK